MPSNGKSELHSDEDSKLYGDDISKMCSVIGIVKCTVVG